jgi:hypothetical protein
MMTSSVIFGAPLLIAAIVMAVRFVGCTQDFDQFEPHGDGDGPPEGEVPVVKANAALAGKGNLAVSAGFPAHDPDNAQFVAPGSYDYAIPYWCNTIDLVLLGAGGGGSVDGLGGNGGASGSWETVTLQRSDDGGETQIPWATTSISVTVGSGGGPGGVNGAPPADGGATTATAAPTTWTGDGGPGGVSPDQTGGGAGDQNYKGNTYSAGPEQTVPGAPGNAPGGGGGGGANFFAGAGAGGAAWIVAYQA